MVLITTLATVVLDQKLLGFIYTTLLEVEILMFLNPIFALIALLGLAPGEVLHISRRLTFIVAYGELGPQLSSKEHKLYSLVLLA